MNESKILEEVAKLVTEEHAIEREHGLVPVDDAARARLRELQVSLDQCWDLLRQRRARRDAGQNPDDATLRSGDVVERYQQ